MVPFMEKKLHIPTFYNFHVTWDSPNMVLPREDVNQMEAGMEMKLLAKVFFLLI